MFDVATSGLAFAYPGTDRLILDGIDLEVPQGEFVCLLGQSGVNVTRKCHPLALMPLSRVIASTSEATSLRSRAATGPRPSRCPTSTSDQRLPLASA